MVVLVLSEIFLLFVTCWCILHEDRLIRFERRLWARLRQARFDRNERYMERCGFRVVPKRNVPKRK